MEAITAVSLSQFVKIVSKLRDDWTNTTTYAKEAEYFDPWFRGQQNVKWLLQPNIYRFGLEGDEDEIRAEFKRRAAQFMTELAPQDEWGWYFLMQHYGAPTRLLDWTDSALIALFFAINSNSPDFIDPVSDAVVWALDPWWLNATVLGPEAAVLLPGWKESSNYLVAPYSHRDSPPGFARGHRSTIHSASRSRSAQPFHNLRNRSSWPQCGRKRPGFPFSQNQIAEAEDKPN